MDPVRSEIAAVAARLIADGGLDYQSAKRRAARDLLGEGRIPSARLPDNDEVDFHLLEHLTLFDPGHGERVERFRRQALVWMERLQEFQPFLTGAAWKGIVARHATLHLQLFTDEQKELEIRLIDDGIHFDVSEYPHFARAEDVTALNFDEDSTPMLLTVYPYDDLRGALRRRSGSARAERGNREAVRALLAADRPGQVST